MSVDLHLARRLVAWGFGIAALTPFLFWLEPPAEHHPELFDVTGRVTYSGRPMTNTYICLDTKSGHAALGSLGDDGSFRLVSFQYNEPGAFAGRYHAHLSPYSTNTAFPAKYRDAQTSGLEIDVASDWNYLSIDLR